MIPIRRALWPRTWFKEAPYSWLGSLEDSSLIDELPLKRDLLPLITGVYCSGLLSVTVKLVKNHLQIKLKIQPGNKGGPSRAFAPKDICPKTMAKWAEKSGKRLCQDAPPDEGAQGNTGQRTPNPSGACPKTRHGTQSRLLGGTLMERKRKP